MTTRTEKPCLMCSKPMLVAKGQEAYYHKQCRRLRTRKGRRKQS